MTAAMRNPKAVILLICTAIVCCSCSRAKGPKAQISVDNICAGKGLGVSSQLAFDDLKEANQMAYEGLHSQAIKKLSEAIKIDPTFGCAYFNRAQSYLMTEQFNRATGDYTMALTIQPRLADAYIGRGLANLRSGKLASAIKDSSYAISIDSQKAYAWSNRAAAKSKQKDHKGAISDYSQALELLPNTAKFLVNRGIEYFRTGEQVSACEDLERAVSLEKDPGKKRTAQETQKALCASVSNERN